MVWVGFRLLGRVRLESLLNSYVIFFFVDWGMGEMGGDRVGDELRETGDGMETGIDVGAEVDDDYTIGACSDTNLMQTRRRSTPNRDLLKGEPFKRC